MTCTEIAEDVGRYVFMFIATLFIASETCALVGLRRHVLPAYRSVRDGLLCLLARI